MPYRLQKMTLTQIYNTQAYIEAHYNESIAVQTLEQISFYSYRNLQRVFKSVYGETMGAYQTRLKVENAYKRIIFSSDSISDIALEVGFSDLQALRKAFTKRYGYSPSHARREKPTLLRSDLPAYSLAAPLSPTIITLPPLDIYYQSIKTDYNNFEIDQLWDRLMTYDFPHVGNQYYGVINDEPLITDSIHCRYDAGVTQSDQKGELPRKTIAGGKYAQFVHEGDYDQIDQIYDAIFSDWLLQTPLEVSEKPILEEYLKFGEHTPHKEEYITHIYIPLL